MKNLLISLLLLYASFAYSQPSIQVQKNYGGSLSDQATSIKQTTDGGFIMVGSSTSNNNDITDHHGLANSADYWVVKTSSNGTIEWKKSYGGSLNDRATDITLTSDGGYAIVGYSNSTDGDIITNATNPGNRGGNDIWVIKITSTGTLQGVRRNFGGSGEDKAYCIKETTDGGFIICGSSYSNDGNLTGMWSVPHTTAAWVIKTLPAGTTGIGDIQWQKVFGGLTNFASDRFYKVSQLSDGSYILGGILNVTNITSTTSTDYSIVKLSSTGSTIWQKTYGSYTEDILTDIKPTSDGGYIAVGYVSSNTGDVIGNHGLDDFWVLKLNSTGLITWSKCYGGTLNDDATSVVELANGSFTIAGYSESSNGDATTNAGGEDTWLINISSTGTLNWQRSYGGTLNEEPATLILTSNLEYVIAGFSSSNIVGNYGGDDYMFIKFTAILPAQITSFTGQIKDNSVVLNWETLNEINLSHFNILKSTDGINFSNIGVVNPGQNRYKFIDNIPAKKSYYKLQIVDKDGTIKSSNTLLIQLNETGISYTVFPNPTTEYLTISFKENLNKEYKLDIYNSVGVVVYKEKFIAKNSNSFYLPKNLPKGIYILNISTIFNENSSQKIFIQ